MALGLLGLKVGMTQVYDENGKIAPVTVLQVGPCPVLQVRNQDRDGYDAVQLGFLDKERRKATRGERGHVSSQLESKRRRARRDAGIEMPPKADVEPQRYIREFRLEAPAADVQVGKVLKANDVFGDVAAVDVIGTSKGRGTAGAMKRHGFAGLPASHGVKKHHRAPGSVGSHASNRGSGRPKKGKRMAGRYGNERVTVRNLTVVRIDTDNNLILVRGAVPGPKGGLVLVRPTNKKG
jgi:large subunit ribosomal protein L3